MGNKLSTFSFSSVGNFIRKKQSRKFNRDLLPSPASYYSNEFPKLNIHSEWAKVHCCFHDDQHPSLSINMTQGHFKCFACGAKGHDIIAFHRLRYRVSFPEAVSHMRAWS